VRNWLAAALVLLFACLGCYRADGYRRWPEPKAQSVTDLEYLEAKVRTLANDNAGADRWVSASDTIALAAYLDRVNSRNGHPELAVEQLRSRTKPSVAELISQRIREVAQDDSSEAVHAVCFMTHSLAHWDPAGTLPLVREQMTRSIALWQAKRDEEHEAQRLADCIAFYTVARTEAGDTDALDEYVDWIVNTTPSTATYEAFSPLWFYPESPAVDEAAKTLFSDPQSSWLPLLLPVGNDGFPTFHDGILETPLVDQPVVRRQLALELTLDHSVAKFRIRSGSSIEVKQEWDTSSWTAGYSIDSEDPIKPRVGARGEVRYGDYLALELSSTFEEFAFGLHWKLPQREAAHVEIAARLHDDAPLFVEKHCYLHSLTCALEDLRRARPAEAGPAEDGSWVDLSVSENSICALSNAGRLWCWQLDPEGLADVVRLPDLVVKQRLKAAHVEWGSGSMVTTDGEFLHWKGHIAYDRVELMQRPVDGVEYVEGACALSSSKTVQCWRNDGGSQVFGVDVRHMTASHTSVCIVGAAGVECGRVLDRDAGLARVPELDGSIQLRVADPPGNDSGMFGELCGRSETGVVTCVGRHLGVETLALPEPVVDFDIDWGHGCAAGKSGRVYCWGDGRSGQLGNGEPKQLARGEWVEVVGLDDAVDVEVGLRLSCALRKAGALSCWGDDQMIPGGGGWVPRRVATGVEALRVLPPATCMRSRGAWRCIGVDDLDHADPVKIANLPARGRLIGDVDLACTEPHQGRSSCGHIDSEELTWQRDKTLRNVTSVSATSYDVAAVSGDRLVNVEWLLDGMDIDPSTFIELPGMVRGAIAGDDACALVEDGSVFCAANAPTAYHRITRRPPVRIEVSNAVDLAILNDNEASCVRHEDRRVSCWGSWVAAPSGVRDMGLSGIVELSAGSKHFCARSEAGTVHCWGSNDHGALGVPGQHESAEPVAVRGMVDVVEFEAGGVVTCALDRAGEVWCWGGGAVSAWGDDTRYPCSLPVEMARTPTQ
jgi:hypothetical protein